MTLENARTVSALIRHFKHDPDEQLRLIELCGEWLNAFHCASATRCKFSIDAKMNAYAHVRQQLEADDVQIATKHIVLRGIQKLQQLVGGFANAATVSANQNGNFQMANLVYDGHQLTHNGNSTGQLAPVGKDIATFLLDYTLFSQDMNNIGSAKLISEVVIAAFFRGYTLVQPNDPSFQFTVYTELLDALIEIPMNRSERTKETQQALDKLRPIARGAFGISQPKSRKRSKPALHFYLTSRSVARAKAGTHEMFNAMRALGQHHNFDVLASQDSTSNRSKADPSEKTLVHMSGPVGPNGLVFRRLYAGPFWQFDTVAARWNWQSATSRFDPSEVNALSAVAFFKDWQERLYPGAIDRRSYDGYIYMPLQGELRRRRSFQTESPLEMIKSTLKHSHLPILATLHPNEHYSDADFKALDHLQDKNERFRVKQLPMERALETCDFIVSQNSSAAFHGIFFEKPAILFAGVDFHHISNSVASSGAAAAFQNVKAIRPAYEKFLYWYWKLNAIDLDADDRVHALTKKMTSLGWDL